MKKSKHIVKIHKKMYNIFILYIKICLIFIISISIFQLFPYNSFANNYIEPHIIENSGTYYFKKGSINNEFFVVHTSYNNEDSINIILNIENQETISIHNKGSWASIDLYNGNDHLLDNPPVIAQINGNIDIYQTMRTNTDCRAINILIVQANKMSSLLQEKHPSISILSQQKIQTIPPTGWKPYALWEEPLI